MLRFLQHTPATAAVSSLATRALSSSSFLPLPSGLAPAKTSELLKKNNHAAGQWMRVHRALSSASFGSFPCPSGRAPVKKSQLLQKNHAAGHSLHFYRALSNDQPVIFTIETVEEFEEHVLQSPTPVLVDFYADWCGPCRMLGPRLEQKVSGRNGTVLMAKVNIDLATDLAMEHNVAAVPTVLAIRDGIEVGRFQGAVSDDQIDAFLDDATK